MFRSASEELPDDLGRMPSPHEARSRKKSLNKSKESRDEGDKILEEIFTSPSLPSMGRSASMPSTIDLSSLRIEVNAWSTDNASSPSLSSPYSMSSNRVPLNTPTNSINTYGSLTGAMPPTAAQDPFGNFTNFTDPIQSHLAFMPQAAFATPPAVVQARGWSSSVEGGVGFGAFDSITASPRVTRAPPTSPLNLSGGAPNIYGNPFDQL